MSPLKALIGLVSLLFGAFFPSKKTAAWPDGEQPLVDGDNGLLRMPTWRDQNGTLQCALGTVYEDLLDRATTTGPELRAHSPAGHSKLFVAAAIQLNDWAAHPDCEAPIYMHSLANQLRYTAGFSK